MLKLKLKLQHHSKHSHVLSSITSVFQSISCFCPRRYCIVRIEFVGAAFFGSEDSARVTKIWAEIRAVSGNFRLNSNFYSSFSSNPDLPTPSYLRYKKRYHLPVHWSDHFDSNLSTLERRPCERSQFFESTGCSNYYSPLHHWPVLWRLDQELSANFQSCFSLLKRCFEIVNIR